MEIISVNCKNCGSASVEPTARRNQYKCSSCGTLLMVETLKEQEETVLKDQALYAFIENYNLQISSQLSVAQNALKDINARSELQPELWRNILSEIEVRFSQTKDPNLLYNMANIISQGKGDVARSDRKAAELYYNAAKMGHPAAMYMFGLYLESGRGVDADEHQALVFYKQSAEMNYPESLLRLIHNISNGKTIYGGSEDAFRYCQKYAGRDPKLYYKLGASLLLGDKDFGTQENLACRLLKIAADTGSVAAMILLGGRDPAFDERSNKYLDKAIAAGDIMAKSIKGRYLISKYDCKKTSAKMFNNSVVEGGLLLLDAAEQGEPNAIEFLDGIYDENKILQQDVFLQRLLAAFGKQEMAKNLISIHCAIWMLLGLVICFAGFGLFTALYMFFDRSGIGNSQGGQLIFYSVLFVIFSLVAVFIVYFVICSGIADKISDKNDYKPNIFASNRYYITGKEDFNYIILYLNKNYKIMKKERNIWLGFIYGTTICAIALVALIIQDANFVKVAFLIESVLMVIIHIVFSRKSFSNFLSCKNAIKKIYKCYGLFLLKNIYEHCEASVN